MMDNGGEVYLMDKEFIKKLMVLLSFIIGDLFTGSFKNGLKHGSGSQYYGNGDYYKG